MKRTTLFSITTTLVVVLCICIGLMVIGSPEHARRYRLDEQRVRDLKAISAAIEHYRNYHPSLPPHLSALIQPNASGILNLHDPKSGTFYPYQIHTQNSYELCSTFETTLDAKTDTDRVGAFWYHGPGEKCFSINVYLPVKK